MARFAQLAPLVAILPWLLVVGVFIKRGHRWRSSFLIASLVWGLLVTAMTELLSLLGSISPAAALTLWSVAAISWAFVLYASPSTTSSSDRDRGLSLFSKVLLGGVTAYGALTFLVAVIAQPNTWDSMTYHLPRVMHWIQNGSLGHYPTHVTRQLWVSPGAEFAVLHLQLLSGSDAWANLVQWFSMMGCVVGVGLIAKELGAGVRGQVFAAAACISVPMGILQSTSTQTDLVVALWMVCFAFFSLRLISQPAWSSSFLVGAALGLALLAKGTTYIYAFPLSIWLVFSMARSLRRGAFKYLLLIGVVAVSLNVGHLARTAALFGNPLSTDELEMTNAAFGLKITASNVARNAALHIGTRSEAFNQGVEMWVGALHTFFDIDINDPRTTFLGTKFATPRLFYREDFDGNPLHFLFIIVAVAVLLIRRESRHSPVLMAYIGSFLLAFLLFCSVMKWQPFHSRLHLPLFVLFAPIIGIALSQWRAKWPGNAAATLLLIYSVPWLFFNITRPLAGPGSVLSTPATTQIFATHPVLEESFKDVALLIKAAGCRQIGLLMETEDNWEYPLWVLLADDSSPDLRIEHVEVDNVSNRIPLVDFEPCAVVSILRSAPAQVTLKTR